MLKAETTDVTLADVLKLLAEPTRLRVLALLEREELSVGELVQALGMAQSRVSNHLRVLREHQLLDERHAGTSTFLRARLAGNANLGARLWKPLRDALESLPERAGDRERLRAVLAERQAKSRAFFDRVAGQWDTIGADFATGQARHRALAHFLPSEIVLADLGCGTGYLTRAMLGLARRVICVDRSLGMLEEARRRIADLGSSTEVELRGGELDALPIADGEVDGAIAAMVLHHLPDPAGCLAEMRRILRPGGTALVLELAPHREAWMHEEQGDLHLGIEPERIAAALRTAGFADVRTEMLEDGYRPPPPAGQRELAAAGLPLYLVRGRAPLA